MFTLVVSLGGVIEKGIFYFKIIGVIFSILTISSLTGIIAFLCIQGFYPEESKWNEDTK